MKYEIKPLSPDNIDGVYEVELSAFSHPWAITSFIEELKNPHARYFVLYSDNEIIGYAGLWHILDEGHITNIAIKKSFQGMGLSNLLMNELIKYKEENSLSFLTLEVRESNEKARRLYEKYNFKEVGKRKNYYENNETAVLYSLEG